MTSWSSSSARLIAVDALDELVEHGDGGVERGDGLGGGQLACRLQPVLELGPRPVGGGLSTPGEAPHPLVEPQVEQLHEELLAILRLGVEELRELALWKDDARGEVLEGQPQQGGDRSSELVGRAGEHVVAGALSAHQPRFLGGGAGARGPHHPDGAVVRVGHGEVEAHPRLEPALADHGRDEAAILVAGHHAVQREADGVDDARLPGPGRAAEREEVGAHEVDLDGLSERREPVQLEAFRAHRQPRPRVGRPRRGARRRGRGGARRRCSSLADSRRIARAV